MMKLAATIFAGRPVVGGRQLHPLSAGRLVVLEERGNPLVRGAEEGAEVSSWVVFEVMLVATLDAEELVGKSMLSDAEWQAEVRRFGLGIDDEELVEFWTILEAELMAIAEARTQPKKKARTRTRRMQG